SCATSPSVVLPIPFFEIHFIVAAISCCRRSSRVAVRRLLLAPFAAVLSAATAIVFSSSEIMLLRVKHKARVLDSLRYPFGSSRLQRLHHEHKLAQVRCSFAPDDPHPATS